MASFTRRKMEGGLLHTEEIEWCPVKLFEQCHRLYVEKCRRAKPPVKEKNIINIYRMIDIWRSICKTIQSHLMRGKGTKIDGIGIFTLDVSGDPCFFPDPIFRRVYGLQPHRKPIKGSTLNVTVQFTSVDKITKGGAPRDEVEQVLAAIPYAIRWALDHSVSSLMLQVGNVGEFVIGEGPPGDSGELDMLIGVRLNADFVNELKTSNAVKLPSGLGGQIEKRRRKREADMKHNNLGLGLDKRPGTRRQGQDPRSLAASATSGAGDQAIELMRKRLFGRHGLYAVRDCRRTLAIIDDSGDGEISPHELKQGFRTLGLALHPRLVSALFQKMDRDGGGSLSIEELYLGLRGNMSKMRNKLVQRCFEDLLQRAGPHQKRGDGVSTAFITQEFSCDHFPDIKSGKKRFDDERDLFISQLDGQMVAPRDGFITREKFIDFYEDINGAFGGDPTDDNDNGDEYFTYFVQTTWNLRDKRGFEPLVPPTDMPNDLDEESLPDTAASVASSERSALVGSSRDRRGWDSNCGAAPGRHRDPVPWECSDVWQHKDMRTSLASMPHKPPARFKLQSSGNNSENEGEFELNESIPPNVFGDLSQLFSPEGIALHNEVQFLPPNDHWNELRRGLFDPPIPFHDFCKKLRLSGVSENPPVSLPALEARIYECGRKIHERWTHRMAHSVAQGIFADASKSTWLSAMGTTDAYNERSAIPVIKGGNSVPVKWLHRRLCTLFGRDRTSAKPKTVLDRLRKTLIDSIGPFGLGELRRHLSLMDVDGNLTLDEEELKAGFQKMGLYLNKKEREEVFWKFDKDKSGAVSYDEFMDGIRGPLTEHRALLVEEAWERVSGGGEGISTPVEDLVRNFDCQWYVLFLICI